MCCGNSGLLRMDQKMWVNVIPGPKARYSLSSSLTLLYSLLHCFQRGGGAMKGTPAQSDLGRKRAGRHQEPLLSHTWGASAMKGGIEAALHANLCLEPCAHHQTQEHGNTGAWFPWRESRNSAPQACSALFFGFVLKTTCTLAPGNMEMTFPDIPCASCVIKLT